MKKESQLLITPSAKIQGLLTIEKAKKYEVGLFEGITFQTFCAFENKSSNYNLNYVILAKTNSWITPYTEPFTGNFLYESENNVKRGLNAHSKLTFAGNDYYLKELTLKKLGQIFPDELSLNEYIYLFNSFNEENFLAFEEYKEYSKNETQKINNYIVSHQNDKSLSKDKKILEARGTEVFNSLVSQNVRVNEILKRMYNGLDSKSKLMTYKIKK